jgi:hypothetical protein
VWPASFDGKYLFADYICGRIFRLDPNGAGGFTRTDVVTGLGTSSAVHLRFGPWNTSQALYYTTYAAGGQIRRISYTAPPTIAGSTWFSNGTKSATAAVGGVVRAFATNAPAGVPYRLVLGTAGCASTVGLLNANTVISGTNGLIPTVQGAVPPGTAAGSYAVCFRSTTGPPTATGVVTLTVQ